MTRAVRIKKNKLPIKRAILIITDRCNYDCSYCFFRGKNSGPEVKNPSLFVRNIGEKLDKNWRFLILGGEPFACKDFFKIVRELVGLGHRVSVYTNFSASEKKIREFLEITKGNLDAIIASLHLEYVNADDFLAKALRVRRYSPDFRFFACSVAQKEKLPYLKEIKRKFFESGIPFYWQPCQNSLHAFFPYSKLQKKLIEKVARQYNFPEYKKILETLSMYGLGGINSKGKKCSAGHRYFVLLPNGDAYPCQVASRERKNYLGNILESNFKLNKRDITCPFDQCFCPAYFAHLSR
jgi:MoaA/NifB/PqqE/SkfB family radical SAM enzyme